MCCMKRQKWEWNVDGSDAERAGAVHSSSDERMNSVCVVKKEVAACVLLQIQREKGVS
jgi:hypothetical protein